MRVPRLMSMVVTLAAVGARADRGDWPADDAKVKAIYEAIDSRWIALTPEEYDRLMAEARKILMRDATDADLATRHVVGEPPSSSTPSPLGALYASRYERCRIAWGSLRRAFEHLDEGVGYLEKGGFNGDSADQSFDFALGELKLAGGRWQPGTPESCWSQPLTHGVSSATLTLDLPGWVEKTKQLGGLAAELKAHKPVEAARIREAPRATVAATAGELPPKYVDNPQYGCGSLAAWQRTVSRARPAGDPKLLPGCSALESDGEGGPTLQAVSRAKRLVAALEELDARGNHLGEGELGVMKGKLQELEQVLADPAWGKPELQPLAAPFERLAAWETNEIRAARTRGDIGNAIAAFHSRYNAATGKFEGRTYDVFAPRAQQCIDRVHEAQAEGVDLTATLIPAPQSDIPAMTYQAALELCEKAKHGMAAKAQADREAAAAEDARWKTLCGGDKYAQWKAHGEFALTRGGWDQSRPEQACKASVWWSHHGPDVNLVYDCEKLVFDGNRLVAHTQRSNRFSQLCPP